MRIAPVGQVTNLRRLLAIALATAAVIGSIAVVVSLGGRVQAPRVASPAAYRSPLRCINGSILCETRGLRKSSRLRARI